MARQSSTRTGLKKYSQVVPSPSHANLITAARAQLKSNAANESGIGNGSLQGTTGQIFTADGYDPNGAKGVAFDLSAYTAQTNVSGWLHMEMSPNLNDGISVAVNGAPTPTEPAGRGTSDNYIISTTDAVTGSWPTLAAIKNGVYWAATGGSFKSYMLGISSYDGVANYIYGFDKTGQDDNYIDIVWEVNKYMDLYWSGLLVSRQDCPASLPVSNSFKYVVPGARTSSSTNNNLGAYVKNFFAAKANQLMDTSGAIGMIGDSLTTGGGLPSSLYDLPAISAAKAGANPALSGAVRPPWAPKNGITLGNGNAACNGFDGAGADTGAIAYGDTGYMACFFRKLGKVGWMPSNNKCYARAGQGSSSMVGQLDAMMTAYAGVIPDILCAPFGTNDYIALGNAASTDATTFDTNAKALLTAAYNYGIKKVIIHTVPKGGSASAYNNSTYDAALLAINTKVALLQDWCISQGYGSNFLSIWDAFTNFGGLTPDLTKFKPAGTSIQDVHYNVRGMVDFGMGFGDIAASWYSSGGSGSGSGVLSGILGSILG